jgi:hypothetical protein
LDIPTVCYLTNYDLVVEKTGKKLEDYESVYEVGLNEYDVIKIVPTLYTLTSVEYHLRRLNYILYEHPPFLNKGSSNYELISRDLEKLIANSKAYFNTMNEMKQKMMGNFEKEKTEGEKEDSPKNNETTTEKKTKPTEDTSTTTTNGDLTKNKTEKPKEEENFKNGNDMKQKISEMDFIKYSLVNYPDSIIYEDHTKPQKFKCVNSFNKSIHNQTVPENKRQGDIVYLEIQTLEGKTVNVTCNERGFFVNNTNPNGVFDPKPSGFPCYSYTLPGLLSQVSTLFRDNFSKLISQVLNVETMLFLPSPSDKYDWLVSKDENPFNYNYRYKNFNYEMDNMKHMRLNKEWNEEFQAIMDLNFQDPLQNLNREKILNDFYKMFKETAVEGAKMIREKKIAPFNFFDSPRANSGYYMYGSIFFTVLEDNYLDFRTFTKDEQKQTYLGSNLDLRHNNFLNSIRYMYDIKDFYFSLNCIVQFKGLRVHAQVITPGVIFNSEHLVEYGEGEEGVIKFNETFHEEYKTFCNKLNLREVTVIDKNEKEYQIVGNPEIKGVRGVDRRKYLFDLIHLFPRDLNYEGSDYNGCLIRPELLKEYQLKLIHDKINSDYKEELNKINQEVTPEIMANIMKDPAAYVKFLEEKYKKKEELFDKVNAEIKPTLMIDPTIGTDSKYLKFNNPHRETDEQLLKNISKFLKEEVLVKFLNEISKDEENSPNDSFTLTDCLHKYGIPIRYSGEILKLIESNPNLRKVNSWLKTLIVRDIIRRSAKHVFNSIVGTLPDYLIKDFSAYFLNILLAPSNLIKYLENFEIVYKEGTIQSVKPAVVTKQSEETTQSTGKENTDKSKKKKKNKNKKKKINKESKNLEIDLEMKMVISEGLNNKLLNSFFEMEQEEIKKHFINPSEFWNRIKEIAKKRYNYILPNKNNFDYVEPVLNKFGLFRDFCLTVGLQMEAFDYELNFDMTNSKADTFKYSSMPFTAQNVINFFPIVKDYQLPSEIQKPIFEQAEAMFKAGNFIEGTEKFKQLIYLSNEVFGNINQYSGLAHKKLGEISYSETDYMNGIVMLQKAIIIFEKLYAYDTNLVANAYSELSTYYNLIGQDYLAFKYLNKGLEIMNYTYPKNVKLFFYFLLFSPLAPRINQ